MNVVRSIVYGVVGPCKTESSQKPVPVHQTALEALSKWREACRYNKSDDWVFASSGTVAGSQSGARRFCAGTFALRRSGSEFRSNSDGILSVTLTQLCCEV
jgi:hypothetical protein